MTTEVDKAETTIATLEDKRKHLNQRAIELADERNKIAFGAHVENDAKARKRLDAINLELATMASEQSSVDAALVEAQSRLAIAKQAEARTADRTNAEALRGKLARFVELGLLVDDAIWDAATSINEMVKTLDEMHQLGAASPTNEQFRVNGTMALKTMLQNLPQLWANDFDFQRLAPNQKKTFKSLAEGWQAIIEQNINARLGTEQKEEAA